MATLSSILGSAYQGVQGTQGTQGTIGIQGVQGLQGLQGTQGVQGSQGLQGTQGTQGVQGPNVWTETDAGIHRLSRVGIGTTNPIARLHLGEGTTSIAPLELNSGTLLTTPRAGTIEYDGTTIWATPTTDLGRMSVAPEFFTSGAGPSIAVAANESVTAPLFPAGNDNIVLPVGTYRLTSKIKVTRAASTTSATLRLVLNDGAATAAAGTFEGTSIGTINAASTTTQTCVFFDAVTLTAATAVTVTNATSSGTYFLFLNGLLKITTAGNFLPSFSLSANLAAGSGSTTLNDGNWMSIKPLSSAGDTVSTGAWA
jgi:hypothetical protein